MERELHKLNTASKREAVLAAIKKGKKIGFFSDRNDKWIFSAITLNNPKLSKIWIKPSQIALKCPDGGLDYILEMSQIYRVGDLLDENVESLFNNPF